MKQAHTQMRIALVEDDPLLRKEIHYHLKSQGFLVFAVDGGTSLDQLLMTEPIDALVLDLSLPGEDGLVIARRIRASIPSIGVVMLTARAMLAERILGYESGADVYLTKPVAPEELTLALRSLYRRLQQQIELKSAWVLDLQECSISRGDAWQKVFLTNSEKNLLLALAQAKNHTVDNDTIFELLNQRVDAQPIGKRALESLISRLRKKLDSLSGTEPDSEFVLKAVWGVGYQLCIPVVVKA